MKRRTYLALFLTLMLGGGIAVFDAAIFSGKTSALSYESEQSLVFTFNPTISVTVSGDLAIANLTPGDYKDSNAITVTAASNTMAGYTLSSTVGSSSNASTELRKDGTSTTNKFNSITTNKASLSVFDDSTNTWGYSYCPDTVSNCNNDSTKWISGDVTDTTATGYNGLPVYTTSSPIKLIDTASAGTSSIQFKIGARSITTQIAGEYTNAINFINVGKVVTTSYTINYNDNSSSATNMPTTPAVGTTTNGAVTISSTEPKRTNYIFEGWCTVTTSDATCSGTTLRPGEVYALNTTNSSVTLNLYAMWRSNS